METLKRRLLHKWSWRLTNSLSYLSDLWNKANKFQDWNLSMHSWMERNHLCCDRHGYKDGNGR